MPCKVRLFVLPQQAGTAPPTIQREGAHHRVHRSLPGPTLTEPDAPPTAFYPNVRKLIADRTAAAAAPPAGPGASGAGSSTPPPTGAELDRAAAAAAGDFISSGFGPTKSGYVHKSNGKHGCGYYRRSGGGQKKAQSSPSGRPGLTGLAGLAGVCASGGGGGSVAAAGSTSG